MLLPFLEPYYYYYDYYFTQAPVFLQVLLETPTLGLASQAPEAVIVVASQTNSLAIF